MLCELPIGGGCTSNILQITLGEINLRVVATAATKTETPVITLKKAGKGKIKVSWKKISGAGGYMVYRKQSGGKYKRIKTITNGNTISYTNSGLVSGRKYVYRVIAYRSAGGKRTYSSYSPAKSITCK